MSKSLQSIIFVVQEKSPGAKPVIHFEQVFAKNLCEAIFDKANSLPTIKMSKNEALNEYLDLRKRIEDRLVAIAKSHDENVFEVPKETIKKI